MFSATLLVVSFAASALANIFTTAPVASTTCSSTSQCTVTWQDDGHAPSLAQFGTSRVSVFVGNAIQQTEVQNIVPSVDVSTTQSVVFTPNANIGESGNFYFIRFQSLGLQDATNPQFPAEAFSAKFTINDLSGTFNATVQAQIDGTSTAPIGGPTPSAAAPSTGSTPASTTRSSSSSSSSSSKASSGTASSAKPTNSNAAQQLTFTGAAGVAGLAAAVLGLAL